MSDLMIGVGGLAAMFAFMVFRMPVGMAMLAAGYFGTVLVSGARSANALLVTETFSAVSNYNLTVIPLFILMGNLLTRSGVSDALFLTAHRALYRLKGGLAMATIVACGGFSAVCGSSLATAATMSKVAMPSMRKTGYADSLATGSIASRPSASHLTAFGAFFLPLPLSFFGVARL